MGAQVGASNDTAGSNQFIADLILLWFSDILFVTVFSGPPNSDADGSGGVYLYIETTATWNCKPYRHWLDNLQLDNYSLTI